MCHWTWTVLCTTASHLMTPQEARVCTWLFEQSHHSLSVLSLSREIAHWRQRNWQLYTLTIVGGENVSAISNSQFCSNGKNMSHQQNAAEIMMRRQQKRWRLWIFTLVLLLLFGVWLWLLLIESKWLASSGFERKFLNLFEEKKNAFLFLVRKISSFSTTQTVHSSINTT